MSRISRFSGALLVSTLLVSPAQAVKVGSIAGLKTATATAATGASGTCYAHCQSVGNAATLTNQVMVSTLNAAAVPHAAGGNRLTGTWPFRSTWGPTRTNSTNTKPNPTTLILTATCGPIAIGLGNADSKGTCTVATAATTTVTATADVTLNQTAYGEALDPLTFLAGSQSITSTIPAGTSLTSDTSDGDAGILLFMTKSDGQVTNLPLFTIVVTVEGVLTSTSDLDITITSDPSLGFNNAALASSLQAAFSVAGNTASLTSEFALPSFMVESSTAYSIEFGAGAGGQIEPAPHFQCYEIKPTRFELIPGVTLVDQFGSGTTTVGKPRRLCVPVDKNDEDLIAPTRPQHYMGYDARRPFVPVRNQTVVNQFGTVRLDVMRPDRLLVPSEKLVAPPPPAYDHLQCYKVKRSAGAASFVPIPSVTIDDQFASTTAKVVKPLRLCTPVDKNGEAPGAETHATHFLCYRTRSPRFGGLRLTFSNQFGQDTFDLTRRQELCVPSSMNP